jgi:hypothetical protein
MLGHFLCRKYSTIRDVAGDLRLAVADDELADRGPQSVSPDQRSAVMDRTVVGARGNTAAGVIHRHDLL